jgi:hypothetical protein
LIDGVSLALILAWWLRIDGDQPLRTADIVTDSEGTYAAATLIQRLFQDILHELDEQGIYYDESGNPVLSPVDFYTSVLDGRVWKCATVMERRLQRFASRLKE